MIADDINVMIDEVVLNYSVQMDLAGEIAWRKVESSINTLDVDEDGKVMGGQSDITTEVDVALLEAIQSSRVGRALVRMQNKLEPIRIEIRKYYEDKFNTTMPYEVVRKATAETASTKDTLEYELSQTNFILNVNSPIIDSLLGHLSAGSTLNATVNDMEYRIKNRMDTFSKLRTSNIMQQYARQINDIYGFVSGRKALYSGPSDDRNRDFCAVRVDKKFTTADIKSWAGLNWDEKMPGTNQNNIFKLLGGINCRHILVWEE